MRIFPNLLRLLIFSKKELPDMQEEEWREFEHWHSERAKCMENIQTLKASLKNPTSLDKFAVELKVQPSTSSRQQVTSKVNKIIKANKSMIVYCSDRLNTLSDQLGFEASSYDVVKSLQQADKNVNAGWKRRCDSHLENIRSCKKTVNNITTIVPIGASGFIGTSEESSGQIDILMREENDDDLGDIVDENIQLHYYDEGDDAQEKDVPRVVNYQSDLSVGGCSISSKLEKVLKPHQKECIKLILQEVIINKRGFLCAHSMGLGKSLTTIVCVDSFAKTVPGAKILITCPKSVLKNWTNEFSKWGDITVKCLPPIDAASDNTLKVWERNGGIILIGHERYVRLSQRLLLKPDCLIVDEAHLLKNDKGLLHQTVLKASADGVKRILLLTGTPLQNHIMEYFSMIRLIQPSLFNEKTFKKDYANPIDRGSMLNATEDEIRTARQKIHIFNRQTADCVHRRSVHVLARALPPKVEYKLTYSAPLPADDDYDGDLAETQAVITSSMSRKIKLATMLLDAIALEPTNKCLVFSKRKDVLRHLLDKRDGYMMDGDTSVDDRQAMIEDFNSDATILRFYMTTFVGGVGLNLQAANHILILDPSWNPSVDKQACFRAYRYGQLNELTIYRFIVENSIEERIYRMAVHKNLAACRICDDKDVDRLFTSETLKTIEEYEYEQIDDSDMPAPLQKVRDKFVHISSHDVLFADSDAERLTEEERSDADNSYNLILRDREFRYYNGQIFHPKKDAFSGSYLIPPLPMVHSSQSFWRPICPYEPELSHYAFEVEVEGRDGWMPLGKYTRSADDVGYGACQKETFELKTIASKNDTIRIRCRAYSYRCYLPSEWSDWSASICVV
ncbi:MAG: hypothetical protein CMB67_04380 [Euryarchaeota archaeon]|nr:hypothetical protein [Euryarchaeota archaeon]|tara:strand:+ start:2728 stop:5274 length:2547 start_codon:yes stop_codon:yes gene_type:complete